MSIFDSIPEEWKEEMGQISEEQLTSTIEQLGTAEQVAIAIYYEVMNEALNKLEKIEDGPVKEILKFLISSVSTVMIASLINKGIEKKNVKDMIETEN